MKNAILLIYPILLLILTFYGAGFSKGGRVSSCFLDLEQTKMIQAAACVGIVLHHITQQVTSYGVYVKGPITVFNYIGFLFTALFFFFSGYGLIISLKTKQDYLHSFLYRRLPAVLVPFWIINALGVLLQTFGYGIHTTPSQVLCDIFGITLINSNGWFIVEIVVFYLFFYVFFRLIRNRDIALVLLCLAVLAVMVYSSRLGHDPVGDQAHWFRGEWWYNSTITFLFGLLFARFQEKMTRLFQKTWMILLPASAILTVVFLQRSIYYIVRGGYYETATSLYESSQGLGSMVPPLAGRTLIAQSAACIAFTMVVLLLQMRIHLGNRALKYTGTISRELFLIHGYFVMRIFGSVPMNDFLRYAVILVCSIACTALISPLIRRLVRLVIRFLEGIVSSLEASARAAAEEFGKKDHRRLIWIAASITLVILVSIPLYRNYRAKQEYDLECAALSDAAIGDEVLWGRYETDPSKLGKERLAWIVIGKDGDQLCLLTKYGIASGYYHQKHEEVAWEDCDLRKRLNSDAFTGIFSRYEKRNIVPVDGDILTLMTLDQVKEVFPTKQDRVCSPTASAEKHGVNVDRLSHYEIWYDSYYCYSWWWLRNDSGVKAITAPIVEMDGKIRLDEKAVNKPSGAIRPVVWVNPGPVD